MDDSIICPFQGNNYHIVRDVLSSLELLHYVLSQFTALRCTSPIACSVPDNKTVSI